MNIKKLIISILFFCFSCSNNSSLFYVENPDLDCVSMESYRGEDNTYLSLCHTTNTYNWNNKIGTFEDISDSVLCWNWNKIYLLDQIDTLIISQPNDTCNYIFVYYNKLNKWIQYNKNY